MLLAIFVLSSPSIFDPSSTTTCSDLTPPGSGHQYTCAQQKSWGKCSASFMKGYCCQTCHNCQGPGCGSGPPSPSPPSPRPPGPSGPSAYITTCHSNTECGSVCGSYSDDIASPSEGIFGTSCSCQDPGKGTRPAAPRVPLPAPSRALVLTTSHLPW